MVFESKSGGVAKRRNASRLASSVFTFALASNSSSYEAAPAGLTSVNPMDPRIATRKSEHENRILVLLISLEAFHNRSEVCSLMGQSLRRDVNTFDCHRK